MTPPAAELFIWCAPRGALPEAVHEAYAFHTFPRITGCGAIVIEEER